ncbi:ABC transporter substrate-binding protein [Paenibacillus flagellatus]|uniref:ABC transporter substrate-binding protein n=1 Tax=Paenibacillus flagellatus TaxID=2211139 RepID=A0A2V5K940_9BACL|nr:extracellular solute-binding protein [Paenibacillus flagellatus]PYI50300.1 hypothetical protein DLM86_29975 [Paenibacillus flagellatus]
MRRTGALLASVVLLSSLLAGCGGGKEQGNAGGEAVVKPKEPFTMKIWGGGVTPQEFDDRFRDVLKKKFPHITVEYIQNGKGTTMPELVAAGDVPDLIRTDVPTLVSGYLDLQLGFDLTELVKKHQYDLPRFNQVFIDEIVDAGRSKALYGLPVPPYFPQALYYNKDLFDRFGVAYPKDGMTWDEVYDLAQKMTRTEGGVSYRGFSSNPVNMLRDNPFSLPILDPNEDRLADPEKWKLLFDNFKRFYEIPNNTIEKTSSAENTAFSKGNVAMMANQHSVYLTIPPEVNWDMVSYPVLPGAPKLMPQRGPAYWSISKTSEHKEEAFEMIMAMLSDEVQMEDSRKGIPTTLVKEDIKKELGKGHPVYSTKNMQAINVYPPVPYTTKRKAGLADVPGATQQTLMGTTFIDVASGKTDVNTALRTLEEKLKAELEKQKNK